MAGKREVTEMIRRVNEGKEEILQCLRRIYERRKTHAQEGAQLDEDEARCFAVHDTINREMDEFLSKRIKESK